jgi:uncharacterized protein (TIGR02611 family)
VPDGLQDPGRTGTNPDIPAADATGGPDDGPPLRHPFRQFFARHRTLDLTYRVAVAVIGAAVVVGGIVLIPLPGPGWLIVFGGLAILATEFEWAGRLLDFARRQVRGWTHWVGRQSLVVRGLIGLVGLLFVWGVLWAYVALQGVPPWLPLV